MIRFLPFILFPLMVVGQSFRDVASQSSIDHQHTVNDQDIGGGVAIFDFNNDGLEDFYVTTGMGRDHLYRNLDGEHFEEVGQRMGLDVTMDVVTTGVIAGDIDNDGFKDLFVTVKYILPDTIEYAHNLLLKNIGGTHFENVTPGSGIDQIGRFSSSATFGDINNDGLLDIYVANYIGVPQFVAFNPETGNLMDGTVSFRGGKNELYINNGDFTFTESAEIYGVADEGCGLGVTMTDINRDGHLDIYVANDFGYYVEPNQVYVNNYPEESFTEISRQARLDATISGMGIGKGDFNMDGLMDYYVTNIGANVLHENKGDGTFREVSIQKKVENLFTGFNYKLVTSWGAIFFDYENDGMTDLLVTNGPLHAEQYKNPNAFFKNMGLDDPFMNMADDLGVSDYYMTRGAAAGDLNNDGMQDFVVVNQNYNKRFYIEDVEFDPNLRVFINALENDHHWVKVELEGVDSNRDGIGSTIKAYAGDKIFLTDIDGGSSHLSQNSTIAHIGLGEISRIDSLEIIWPGGKVQVVYDLAADQLLSIRECADGDPECVTFDISERNHQVTSLPTFPSTVTVFPQPAEGWVKFDIPDAQKSRSVLEIFDLQGRSVLKRKINGDKDLKVYREEVGREHIYLGVISSDQGQISFKVFFR